jgi:hypothetical protein
MKSYAQLNENNICIGISQLSGEVIQSNMIDIQSFDNDKLWRKYENKAWSAEKFEPQSTAPISEFEALQMRTSLLETAVEEIALGGM